MIRAVTTFLALLTLALTVGCGEKTEGTLAAIISSSDEQGTYRAQSEGVTSIRGDGSGMEYALYTMYRMDSIDFTGEGSFDRIQDKVNEATEHKPGESTEGVDILYCFYQTPDGRYIIRQLVEGITPDGEGDIDVKAEAEITKGSWEDFLAGKTITVMFTEAGLEEYYKVATDQAEELFRILGEADNPGVRLEFDFEWESQPNAVFEVSLKEMTYKMQGDSKLKMMMKAYR
ncbi:MAG: hypothetical protein AAGI37_08390 [Planctomycetota bacterium]